MKLTGWRRLERAAQTKGRVRTAGLGDRTAGELKRGTLRVAWNETSLVSTALGHGARKKPLEGRVEVREVGLRSSRGEGWRGWHRPGEATGG